MPWKMSDALRHTGKAATPGAKKQWASTANAVLKRTGDEGQAVRVANAAVKKAKVRKPKLLKVKK